MLQNRYIHSLDWTTGMEYWNYLFLLCIAAVVCPPFQYDKQKSIDRSFCLTSWWIPRAVRYVVHVQ